MVIKRICSNIRTYANSLSFAKYVKYPSEASLKKDIDFYKRLSKRPGFLEEDFVVNRDLSDLLEDLNLN
jgi:hypothetical protein